MSVSPQTKRVRKAVLRTWALAAHRWLGLALVGFLVVAGLTGSMMAFYPQLNAITAPSLFRAKPPTSDAPLLDPLVLRERLLQQRPGVEADTLPLRTEPGKTLMFPVQPAEPKGNDELYVDPYTGKIQGERRWGDAGQGLINAVPFVYRVHYCLTVDGIGQKILGCVALAWLFASVLGLALTFPATARGSVARWRVWRSAWRPRVQGSELAVSFSLHRAGGLWLWLMCIVMAWSAVGLTLGTQVYQPVMRALGGAEPPGVPRLAQPIASPALSWSQALQTARAHVDQQMRTRGERVEWEDALRYDRTRAAFAYRVHTNADIGNRRAHTTLWLDAQTGKPLAFQPTTGTARGQWISAWLLALHRADLGALAYRIFECVFGLALAGIAISGTCLWWKRHARH
ncbi:PepSY-associated TM helix domain-containing protein [Arthrobacter sp. NPDC080086]|uniref:PepSY-associated TM helix domain-containing protein n=1 Tax=Arthrobacter sp. NPDC080086 TaxID=3155917 RepID=UPI00344FBFE5